MLSWNVRVKGGDPFDLTGQDLSLYRLGFNGRERIETFEVYGNVVKWSWPGAEQNSPGTYSFLLVMNENKEGMRTLEACEALRLVASSCGTCIGIPDHLDLEGILDDYLQAVDKANEAADKAIRAANEASKVISSMESALDSIKKLLSSGSVYIGVLSSGGEIPKENSNAFMLCGPGKYSVGGSTAEVGIGQLGILSNASGQWKMETVQVVEVLQSMDAETALTSPNPASASAIMTFLDTYLKAVLPPVVFASLFPEWKEFFSKIDDIDNITGPLDFSRTNYLTKEENLKDACMQLDEEVKAANDNIAILGAEAANLAKTKQDKLSAGTGIAIQGNTISCTLDTNVFEVVQSLPERPETGKENKIYVVPNPDGQGDNVYDEYAWINGAWEKVGEFKAEVDLSAYQTKQDDSLQTEAKTVVGAINELQSGKLDVNNYFSKIGSSAMRPIYEACGAVWNAETGYYELNGLTDITEEQMMWIYIETFGWWKSGDGPICRYCSKARTNIRPMTYGVQFNERALFPFSEGVFETLNFDMYPTLTGRIYPIVIFNYVRFLNTCRILTVVTGVLRLYYQTSGNFEICTTCPLLREIRLQVSNNSGSFCKDSPLLSYESMKYLVDNARNTKAIVITINPATYSYLSGTAQPTEEVGGTTEEWQALMTAAASKQISFATEE